MQLNQPDFSTVRAVPGSEERVIAVGDIHGRLDLLKVLMNRIAARTEHQPMPTKLVFLGDYIDRGDESEGVLNVLAEVQKMDGIEAKFILGNHEDMMLAFLKGHADGRLWMANGGLQTLASFGMPPIRRSASSSELEDTRGTLKARLGDLLGFLETLEQSWQWGDFFFSHAGIDPSQPTDKQKLDTLVWGHPDFLDHQCTDRRCVIHGHYISPDVTVTGSRIGLDTGAFYSGNLSALSIAGNEFDVINSLS